MKKHFILVIALLSVITTFAQVPNITLKDINGKAVQLQDAVKNDGNPVIIDFWATWCKPCIKELKAISDVYEDWQKETGVKMIIVSIDDSRTTANVRTLVNAQGWDFDVLLDVNSDLKRAMNVSNPPHTFVLDGKGKIVFQHNGYSEGSEEELIDEVRKAKAGK
ncbi:MAG: TlpA family protein disulfide reductase [Bacteroidales bacterium]|jgi:peroxiredoxin|nr:TlpA family protein disulfide reductase [Bacteroidales bacterium]